MGISEKKVKILKDALIKSNKPVLMQNEFNKLVKENLSSYTSLRSIKESLIENGILSIKILKSEGYKDVERIEVPELHPTPYHYAVSLRKKTYLTHASALNILGLTQQIPKTIYVNKEQFPKKQSTEPLTQESIDRAFANQQRKSKYIFKMGNYNIVLLSGKATNNAGVETDKILNLPRTCLERTLIDITVRPRYAGSVFNVLEAFQNSIKEINYVKLLELLKKIDYKYPYHQSLGFYLEKAGAPKKELQKLRDIGIEFNFYLDYSMASTSFNEPWRVFHPLGI